MKSLLTRVLYALYIEIAAVIGAIVIRMIMWSVRWEYSGSIDPNLLWNKGGSKLITFWHNRQLMMPHLYLHFGPKKKKPMYTLISLHRDGRLIARAMQYFGVNSIGGSSSRNAMAAMVKMIRRLSKGCHGAITPDGPRGPLYKLKPGVLKIAQKSGALIYPASYGTKHKWMFSSWDKMILPKPFSRAVMVLGAPISVARDATTADLRNRIGLLEAELNRVTEVADTYEYK